MDLKLETLQELNVPMSMDFWAAYLGVLGVGVGGGALIVGIIAVT